MSGAVVVSTVVLGPAEGGQLVDRNFSDGSVSREVILDAPAPVDPLAGQRATISAGLAAWPTDGNPVNKAALEVAVALIDDKIGAAS